MSATATLERPATDIAEAKPDEAERALMAASERAQAREAEILHGKACKAAVRYLELKGYEVLAQDWPCDAGLADVICMSEDGELVFVSVGESYDGFPDEDLGPVRRAQLESMAMAYLAEYEHSDTLVRFDSIGIVVIGEDRAFLRHHVNVLGTM